MVSGHAVAVAFGIEPNGLAVDFILACGEADGVACLIDENGGNIDARRNVVHGYDGNIVGSVLAGGVPTAFVDALDLFFCARERVAYPTCKFTFIFLDKKLCAISAAFAEEKLSFDSRSKFVCAVFIVDLVAHIFVVGFYAGFKHIIVEVAEVAEGHLVSDFGADIIGVENPFVCGAGAYGVGNKMYVLGIARESGLYRMFFA